MAPLTAELEELAEVVTGHRTRAPRGVPFLSIRGYGLFVARYRWLIGAAIVLGVAAGLLLALSQPLLYTAGSRVALTPQETSAVDQNDDRPRLVSLDSDAQLLTSSRVLAAAAGNLGDDAPAGGVDALRDALVVSAVPNSRVLIVRYSDPSPDLAVVRCEAIVDAFLAERAAAAASRTAVVRSSIESQIDDLSDRLALLGATGGADLVGDTNVEQELQDQVAALQQQLAALPSQAADPGLVISAAHIRDAGQRPMAAPTVASGALLGLVGGLLLARGTDIARDLRRRRHLLAAAARVAR